MNDDELNLIISRSDEEAQLYREMDNQREREALESWRAQGNRGKPPPPLIQLEELPECYQTEEPFEVKEIEELAEGRGQRRRNVVSYNDGLDDDTWAMVSISSQNRSGTRIYDYDRKALEDGEDLQELSSTLR